jgi:hypothetical protein
MGERDEDEGTHTDPQLVSTALTYDSTLRHLQATHARSGPIVHCVIVRLIDLSMHSVVGWHGPVVKNAVMGATTAQHVEAS